MALKKFRKATPKKVVKKQPTAKKAAPKKVVKKQPTAKKAAPKKVVKKNSKSIYLEEEAFLESIEPYKLSKKENYMSAKQKNHFGKILGKWKKMLEIEQDRTADKIQSNNSYFADEADRATHEEVFTLEIRTRERERRLLSKIENSFEDLDCGNYGYCINPFCGVEIGIRRLEARPTASLCIDCKTLEEIKERQQYGQK